MYNTYGIQIYILVQCNYNVDDINEDISKLEKCINFVKPYHSDGM